MTTWKYVACYLLLAQEGYLWRLVVYIKYAEIYFPMREAR